MQVTRLLVSSQPQPYGQKPAAKLTSRLNSHNNNTLLTATILSLSRPPNQWFFVKMLHL
jgi:hypothetical protein